MVALGIAFVLWAESRADAALSVALMLAGFTVASVVGFLIGGPGAASGEDGTEAANKEGWGSRIGVFGSWLTGAAFALVIANAGEIVDWFANLTRTVATKGDEVDTSLQYTVGALIIASVALGFLLGVSGMLTFGRVAFSKSQKAAEEAAKRAAVAAEAAQVVAQTAQAEVRHLGAELQGAGVIEYDLSPPTPPA